jgi:hypothetical protein
LNSDLNGRRQGYTQNIVNHIAQNSRGVDTKLRAQSVLPEWDCYGGTGRAPSRPTRRRVDRIAYSRGARNGHLCIALSAFLSDQCQARRRVSNPSRSKPTRQRHENPRAEEGEKRDGTDCGGGEERRETHSVGCVLQDIGWNPRSSSSPLHANFIILACGFVWIADCGSNQNAHAGIRSATAKSFRGARYRYPSPDIPIRQPRPLSSDPIMTCGKITKPKAAEIGRVPLRRSAAVA